MVAREIKPQASGYSEAGASLTRRALRGFIPNSSAPREDIDANNETLRQRSRMLYMSAPPATAAIDTNRTHVIGTGLTMQAAVDRQILGISEDAAKEWQHRAEAEFRLWAEDKYSCDALGLNNFSALQQLALKSWLMSGDAFALVCWEEATKMRPYGLRIRIVEADRVCTPSESGTIVFRDTVGKVPEGKPGAGNRIYDGVEIDENGKVAAYHVASDYPSVYINTSLSWQRVPVIGAKTGLPNILPIMDSERPDQYRGVPYLSKIIEPLLQLRRFTESELMSALIQSFFSAWIQTDAPAEDIPLNEVGDGSENDGDNSGVSENENEYEMGPGTICHLRPGEQVVFGNPNIPTVGFEAFEKAIWMQVGAALEVPYDVLIKEFNSSYSASRGALMEAWEAFKMRRHWFVDDFCQPVYEIWLTEAVARGRIKAPGFFDDPLIRKAWSGASWIGPVQIQLDPVKEANAAILMTSHAIKTHKQITRELGGGDWDVNIEQVGRENEQLAQAGTQPPQINTGEDEGNGKAE